MFNSTEVIDSDYQWVPLESVRVVLNHPSTVICTHRHKSFCPVIRISLSRAHHRYDVRHIEENFKGNAALNRALPHTYGPATDQQHALSMKDTWLPGARSTSQLLPMQMPLNPMQAWLRIQLWRIDSTPTCCSRLLGRSPPNRR
jgi:hypothetical protein